RAMNWEKKPIHSGRVKEFAASFDLDLLASAIFVRREIDTPELVQYFLEDDLRFLHNPFLFDEMSDAVQRIQQAIAEGERVHVFGDRDVDGITSTALMTEALQNLGLEVTWGVPMGDDPYGLTREIVDRLIEQEITLLIAVDCGTTNVDEITYASEAGIDTIVIDHHNPQEELPPAVALINPKMPDSSYPFDGLCACGLVSKVRYALGFAHTDFFNQPICLLNVRPGNDSLILDAVKLENMVEIDRISENIVPGVLDVESSRLGNFLRGLAILVYDATAQEALLRQAFGTNVEVGVIDVAPEVWKLFPTLANRSLLRLKSESRLSRYTGSDPGEIDVFLSLFTTFVSRKEVAILEDLVASLDLVALGTLADMMPLQNENRILVKQGLRRMTTAPRPGLRSLLERQKLLGKTIVARDIGWTVSPVINASGRMGEPDRAVRLLLTTEASEREELADSVVQLNTRRREVGEQAWSLVQDQARASHESHAGRFILVHNDSIHRGVTGILAGRLARQFSAPAAVVSILSEKAVGSVRTARGVVVTDLLARCDDIFSDWGGHDQAGGFHLAVDRVAELEQRLLEVIPSLEMEEEIEKALQIDAELTPELLTLKILETVKLFAPFGQANPPLSFLVRNLRVIDITFMGREQNHLRMTFDAGNSKWPAVYWNAADQVGAAFDKD
ncbi:MAG TPA: single-stranded-DNA-specific exonuclease RecJ, partial [Spirochaetia bacterium]|nr:single-stranded-DNA-specific exonuclease RecJ [Spirochaetia bacterium]